MELTEIINGCKKNNLSSQRALYDAYCGKFLGVCIKYTTTREDAQDILHDAFLIIFQSIKKYKGIGSFEGWMRRILINTAIKKFKKEKLHLNLDHIDVEEPINIQEDLTTIPLESILKCIQELPPQYRLIFNLYEMDQYSHKEIAELLSISTGTSKSNLHRAKLILKEKIQNLSAHNTRIVHEN